MPFSCQIAHGMLQKARRHAADSPPPKVFPGKLVRQVYGIFAESCESHTSVCGSCRERADTAEWHAEGLQNGTKLKMQAFHSSIQALQRAILLGF